MSARYITQSLGRAFIAGSRRFAAASAAATTNQSNTYLGFRPSSSSTGTPSPEGGRYIDKVLYELRSRGLKENSDIHSQDAFRLFQLEKKFLIDESKLKKEMVKLQLLLHPDRFVCKDRESQQKSDHLSSLVNEAYSMLKNPYRRAKYLLSLMSIKTSDDVEQNLDDLKLDSDFLERMMDLREKIDSCSTLELSKLHSDLDLELTTVISEVNRGFRDKQYDSILKKLGKLKFLSNCMEAIENRLGRLNNY